VGTPTAWEMFAAQKAVDFIAQGSRILPGLTRSHFAANVRALRYGTFGGNKAATARAVLHSRKTVECWCNESQVPMLASLLMIGFRLGIEPISLLTEDVSDRIRVNQTVLSSRCILQVRPVRRHTRKELRAALAALITAKEYPPPSMNKVALRLKCHQSYLARAFPDLVAELKAQYQVYFDSRRRARSQMVRGLVRSATIDAHASGKYPSAKRVCSGLPRFVDMRDVVAREEWKRTLKELGLVHEKN